jgi:hypothetical protein
MIVIAHIALGIAFGFAMGFAFFAHLRRAAFNTLRDGRAWVFAGGAMMRMSGALLAFFALAQLGTTATVSGLAGFTLARLIVVRRQS